VDAVAIPVNLTGQNWLITPAANPPGTATVTAAGAGVFNRGNPDQLWLLVLTGVGTLEFAGNTGTNDWLSETVRIVPDVQAPLASVSSSPVLGLAGTQLAFNLVLWAPFAAISGVAGNDGFALSDWRPTPFIPTLVDSSGKSVPQVFQGIDVDLGVLRTSVITGVSYNITLLGRIVQLGKPVFAPPASR
jgi:hypothetical protein